MNISDKVKSLKTTDLNCNVFDVYNYDGLSMQELLCQFFTKINECIKVSNDTIDLATWLVNEGLKIEVVEKLMLWMEDGTLENLINVNLFNTLHSKIENISYFVTPEQFGAKGDGFTDDTNAIKSCFDYAIINNSLVKFNSGKTYIISSQLTIKEHLNVDFNNATLKVSKECNELVNVLFLDLSSQSSNNEVGYYINLKINCNNNAQNGFVINNGKKGKVDNVEVYNANNVGFYIKTCHELAITNIRVENCEIGVKCESTDINFRGIYGRYCRIGVQNLGGSNFYTDVHMWNNINSYYDSVFFEISSTCIINNSYSDTYETSYKFANRSTIILNNVKYMWNEELVQLSNKPVLFDFGDYPHSSDNLVITNNYVNGATNGVIFSKQSLAYELGCRIDETNRFYRVEGYTKGINTNLTLNEGFSVVNENISLKDNRVNVVLKLERVGEFAQNKQVVPFRMLNTRFHPTESTIFNGFYSLDDGYKVDGVIYGQLASNGDFRFKYPKEDSTASTTLYIYLNFSYDV